MKVLNKTKRTITLIGASFSGGSVNDTIKTNVTVNLESGINDVSDADFKSVNKSYIDMLVSNGDIEVMSFSKKSLKEKKIIDKKQKDERTLIDNIEIVG